MVGIVVFVVLLVVAARVSKNRRDSSGFNLAEGNDAALAAAASSGAEFNNPMYIAQDRNVAFDNPVYDALDVEDDQHGADDTDDELEWDGF